jgi:hypothetical protein
MLPALALLLGDTVAEMAAGRLRRHLAVGLLLGLALLAAPPLARTFAPEAAAALPEAFDLWLQAAGAVLAAGAAFGLYQATRGSVRGAVVAAALAALLAAQLGNSGAEAFSPSRSGYDLAVKIAPLLGPDTPFYSFGMYEQTLPFYLKRTTTLVGSAEEMAFGLAQEPQLWIGDPRDFGPRWRAEPGAIAVTRPALFELLERHGVPMRVVARDERYVVVVSP